MLPGCGIHMIISWWFKLFEVWILNNPYLVYQPCIILFANWVVTILCGKEKHGEYEGAEK